MTDVILILTFFPTFSIEHPNPINKVVKKQTMVDPMKTLILGSSSGANQYSKYDNNAAIKMAIILKKGLSFIMSVVIGKSFEV